MWMNERWWDHNEWKHDSAPKRQKTPQEISEEIKRLESQRGRNMTPTQRWVLEAQIDILRRILPNQNIHHEAPKRQEMPSRGPNNSYPDSRYGHPENYWPSIQIVPNDPNEPQGWYLRWVWEVTKALNVWVNIWLKWVKWYANTKTNERPVLDMDNFELRPNWYNTFTLVDKNHDDTYIISKKWESVIVNDEFWRNINVTYQKIPQNTFGTGRNAVVVYEQNPPYHIKFEHFELEMKFAY